MTADRVDRMLDLTLGTLLLIVSLPAMAFSAALVFVTSGRPVLFRQQRIGKGGVPFEILKFRSMIRGADQMEWPQRKEGGALPEFSSGRRDHRITPAGRILRRLSLDELPQLFNVLRGNMSLVGPRPRCTEPWVVTRHYVGDHGVRRNSVRPGMTGPEQVVIRLGMRRPYARQLEMQYVKWHSPWEYWKWLILTLMAVLVSGGDTWRRDKPIEPEERLLH